MTTVDPYVVRSPEVLTNKDGTPSDQMRAWLDYDNRWKHDLWQLITGGTGDDTTGGTDEASANENQIALLQGLLSAALERIHNLEAETPIFDQPKEFRAITKSNNYTAVDRDFINAKRGATITLPSNPAESATIIVRNGDGSIIKLRGNNKHINGSSNGKIYKKGTALVLQYFIDSNEWLVR